ncbi:sperm-associated antigen 8 isoform X2 [Vidua chalybeata]|uniref:sperm-associated antigen 8 isoform X2 n=1 Tax=Vidua chalybeata TaxID=81927 RepID=UPI0023A90DFD|nr:sperm-associated antigen 8 isoform X2 [Vidua chalybeata]
MEPGSGCAGGYSWIPWTLDQRRIWAARTCSVATMDSSLRPEGLPTSQGRAAGARAAEGHTGIHVLREIQASLHSRMRPTLRAMPQRRGPERCGVCSHCSKEMEEEIRPRPRRMESISITHQDYCAMGFQSTPQPLTQVQAVHIPPASLQQPPGRLQGSACPAEHAIPTGSHSASTAASQLLNRAANQLLAGASLWTTRCHCLLQQKHSLQEECRLFHSHYHVLRAS